MSARVFLIAVTAIAVVSDSMLIPFYPQLFADAFGVTDPVHVGSYIAACCFTVMVALPFWAFAAAHVRVLGLLIFTQLAAGLFSALCYWSDSALEFWVLSLSMFVFKASYLLVYPFVMSLEPKQNQFGTIGLLSVIVHFGGIFGAVFSGFLLRLFEPRHVLLAMAASDVIQALACIAFGKRVHEAAATAAGERSASLEGGAHRRGGFLVKLSLVMLVFYFSAFVVRPFFSTHWESVSASTNTIVTGLVFAIPGVVALISLRVTKQQAVSSGALVAAICAAFAGCLLQAVRHELAIVAGRCVFGWAIFHVAVRLDLLLFERSRPEAYGRDFSKIHIFQQLGVLVSSFAAGSLVAEHGLRAPFLTAAIGFLGTAALCRYLLDPVAATAPLVRVDDRDIRVQRYG